ncbi:transcriptional regulatory protein [Serratia plymuthica 4Rx13]|uniref:CerR family C-terminal domain-containing protein n=1 Tax=Serratia plymuthica TaxID=82996 RepID=UPI0001BED336|nr:CerR family C-terminal domain-containing protein [Serratia plymuthica]AGO53391.1 transcriptional regulatory protein [Serratia plymuthica 4Rx13]
MSLFSKQGLEGVRTRQLADEAGVNQSAIPYHFGGKEGVYLAVLEHVANGIVEHLALPRLLSDSPSPAAALQALMQDFVRALLGSETSTASSLLLAREQLQPSAEFDALYSRLFLPLHQAVSELVAAIRGQDPALRENILCAHAILGQALAFSVAREALLRRLGGNALQPQQVAQIAELVGVMAVAAAQH